MADITTNKSINYDYNIIYRLEAGIVLESYEIKQIVNKLCNIKGSFARIINNEVILFNMHIEKYNNAVFYINMDETRNRKLLLHKKEIRKISEMLKLHQHYTIVPYKIYTNDKGIAKLDLCVVQGKKNYQKKASIKEKDILIYNKINYKEKYD